MEGYKIEASSHAGVFVAEDTENCRLLAGRFVGARGKVPKEVLDSTCFFFEERPHGLEMPNEDAMQNMQ